MCEFCYTSEKKAASAYTRKMHQDFAKEYGIDLNNAVNEELELANENCIFPLEDFEIKNEEGKVVWTMQPFSFYKEKAVADTVHPSLWLNGKSNFLAGVFEVVKGSIYQVRGLDATNITFVRTKNGWIVMDPGMSTECAHSAMLLAEEALHEKIEGKIKAIIVSHTHLDHFGGVGGIVLQSQVGKLEDGKIPIYVPAGFEQELMKENVYVGNAMSRRGALQGGRGVDNGVKGRVSLGAALTSSTGTLSYLLPSDYIKNDCCITIDGIEVEFQLTPNTEAPVEMNNFFPEYRAFWAAENCSATLHNLYPIRGAQLRDAANWWRYTNEALERYGDKIDVVFQAHNWPHFNSQKHPGAAQEFLRNSAAVYKFIHDETLHYANRGLTAREIAKKIQIPEYLKKIWYIRPYYGSVEINVRAVYTKYLGFFNAHPVDINPLTELEEAEQFVEYVGSEERVMELASKDFEQGNYQKAAKAASYVVYVNPDNKQARYLCADAFEQQGYQSESSIWRNAYLTGAAEMRYGTPKSNFSGGENNPMLQGMTTQMLLDYLGIVIDSSGISTVDRKFRLNIRDTGEVFIVHVYYGTVLYYEGDVSGELPHVTAEKELLLAILSKRLNSVRNNIDTDCYEIIETLERAVVDFSIYRNFPLIER